jgi:arylsulfatase A-like enzyme
MSPLPSRARDGWDRRRFLRTAVGGLAAIPAAWPPASGDRPDGRPNILFVLTDDQRWDALGCAGNPVIQTPVVDRLACDGARFERAFVTTPICAASRASILTGLYKRTHHYTFEQPPLPASVTAATYPSLLRQAGYRTGFVGKAGVASEKGTEGEMYDVFQPSFLPFFQDVGGEHVYLTDLHARQATDFIRGTPPGQPFCLSVSFWAPHADDDRPEQYFWPPSLDGLYRDVTITPPPTSDPAFFESLPEFLRTPRCRDAGSHRCGGRATSGCAVCRFDR